MLIFIICLLIYCIIIPIILDICIFNPILKILHETILQVYIPYHQYPIYNAYHNN